MKLVRTAVLKLCLGAKPTGTVVGAKEMPLGASVLLPLELCRPLQGRIAEVVLELESFASGFCSSKTGVAKTKGPTAAKLDALRGTRFLTRLGPLS